MTKMRLAALIVVLALGPASAVSAQEPAPPAPPAAPAPPPSVPPAPPKPPPAPARSVTPLKLQVVLSRYEGEKKVASLPYVLMMDARGNGMLAMGVQVAVPSGAAGNTVPIAPAFNYKHIGTTVNGRAEPLGDGRFHLDLTVQESSVLPDRTADADAQGPAGPVVPVQPGVPMFPDFSLTGALVLASGETAEFGTATNPVTGQVTKVDVTLTVLK